MNKKTYIAPSIEVVNIESTPILAGSPTSSNTIPGTPDNNGNINADIDGDNMGTVDNNNQFNSAGYGNLWDE